jgi:hypothetical protein
MNLCDAAIPILASFIKCFLCVWIRIIGYSGYKGMKAAGDKFSRGRDIVKMYNFGSLVYSLLAFLTIK